MSSDERINELIEHFEFFDDWEDRYAHLIELGDGLPAMPAALQTDATKVDGCMSAVWMHAKTDADGRVHIQAQSDARIVRGLIAVLLLAYQAKTPAEIAAVDIEGIFGRLGLDTHLSMNRRNGFAAMVARIRQYGAA